MKTTTLTNQSIFEDHQYDLFPCHEVAKILVECGAKVNALDNQANTPLHTAVRTPNYAHEVILFHSFKSEHVSFSA